MDKIITSFTESNNKFICNIQSIMNDETIQLKNEIMSLKYKNKKLNEEINDFKKVSFIKNLNNQLKEKDKIIKHLENELDLLKKSKSNKVVEEEDVKVAEVMEEGLEEEVMEEGLEEEVMEEGLEEEVMEEEVMEEGLEEEVMEEGVEDEEEEVVEEEEDEEVVEVEDEEEVEEEEVEVAEVEDEEEVEEEEDEEVVEVEDEEVAEVEDEEVAEVEDEEVEDEEVEVEEVEEVEVEFSEKKLKPPNSTSRKLKYYFITDDENKDIYEKLENGELGEHVGKLIGKQNKPFFFE